MFANEIIKRQWLLVSDYISAGRFMHYSFDFWNTIAFPNPTFKHERAEFIYKLFNDKYNKDLIKKSFTKVGIDNNGMLLTVDQLCLKVFVGRNFI